MLKRLRGFVQDPAFEHASKQIANAERHAGDGVIQYVDINLVDLDSNQPRELAISTTDICDLITSARNQSEGEEPANLDKLEREVDSRQAPNDDRDRKKQAEMQVLVGLAKSIQAGRLQNPVSVYESGSRFQLISGERRYLAHLLLQTQDIRAIVRPKPDEATLREMQLVENMQRADLSLWERITGLKKLEAAKLSRTGEGVTLRYMGERLGLQESQASNYMALMKGPDDLLQAIQSGTINSLRKAHAILQIGDVTKRREAIKAAIDGVGVFALRARKTNPKARGRGRPIKAIKLGSTANSSAVKYVLKKIHGSEFTDLYAHVNWGDYSSVREAWISFWKYVEEQTR